MIIENTFYVYYLNNQNVVIDVSVFSLSASQELLNNALQIKKENNATIEKFVSSIDFGLAAIGYVQYRDYFRLDCTFASWIWNEKLRQWEAPIPRPSLAHEWNEGILEWVIETR